MMEVFDGCLPDDFRMIVSGSSATGKSTFVHHLLANENGLMEREFERIIYLQGVETECAKDLQEEFGHNMIVFNGIPPEEVLLPLCRTKHKTVLIVEDLDQKACSSPVIAKFFTAYAHHHKTSVILSTQNMFCPGKERLTLVRNATHLVLFPNFLDLSVIRMLAHKLHPEDPKHMVRLFEKVTSEPFGYLSVWGNCDPRLKFRSKICEKIQVVHVKSLGESSYLPNQLPHIKGKKK